MTKPPLKSVRPNTDLNTALQMLAGDSLNQVVVMENGKLLGLLSRADIIRHLQLSQELGVRLGAEQQRPSPTAP
jgi:CBS-domain-containing membrane protein